MDVCREEWVEKYTVDLNSQGHVVVRGSGLETPITSVNNSRAVRDVAK